MHPSGLSFWKSNSSSQMDAGDHIGCLQPSEPIINLSSSHSHHTFHAPRHHKHPHFSAINNQPTKPPNHPNHPPGHPPPPAASPCPHPAHPVRTRAWWAAPHPPHTSPPARGHHPTAHHPSLAASLHAALRGRLPSSSRSHMAAMAAAAWTRLHRLTPRHMPLMCDLSDS